MPETPGSKSFIINYVRAMGIVFVVVGMAVGFNISGAASAIGLTDGPTQKILGSVAFVMGLVDFFVLPVILSKKSGGQS